VLGEKWHYRFTHQGREWTGSTGLAATKRNEASALSALSKAREAVRNGRADQLSLQVKRFDEAEEEFLRWAAGEHREHPGTVQRLSTSFVCLKRFFGTVPLHTIGPNDLEKFKTWRRLECKVSDVTIHHDLYAMSPLFKYGINANWCRDNPVKRIDVPSTKDAVRDHVVSEKEEKLYFETALSQFELVDEDGKISKRGPFQALHDVAR
jgi:hypothetical protein